MSNVVQFSSFERVVIQGDLAGLSVEQRGAYYNAVCDSLGLNPLTRPFDYINLNGKLTLYAKKDATDQLRKRHSVSVMKLEKESIDGIYVVTAYAKDSTGREDSSTGAVAVANLKGEALANAMMKAETKAKRRVTLSICGLGMLDETEVESIPQARTVSAEEPLALQQSDDAEPSLGDFICRIGKKYRDMKLSDIGENDLDNYANWLSGEIQKKGRDPHSDEKDFLDHAFAYLKTREFEHAK